MEIISDTHFREANDKKMIEKMTKYMDMKGSFIKTNINNKSNIKIIKNKYGKDEKITLNYDFYKILSLCGDICSENQLLLLFDFLSPLYDHIFFVPGNHEYYYNDMDKMNNFLNIVNSFYDNITIFTPENKFIYFYNDLIIFGSTLWTFIDEEYELESKKINSFNKIFKNNKKLNINDTNKIHIDTIKNLINIKKFNKNIIVLTHHPPSFESASLEHCGNHLSYAADLDNIITYPIITWVYGHSHCDIITYINNVLVCSNQWEEYNKVKKTTIIYYF